MAEMIPIETIVMIETAGAPIVTMIAAEAMAHGMMIAAEVVIMVLGGMTAEDTITGTTTATALAINATITTTMTVMAGQLLPEIATEVMWIIGTGIGMKGQGVLLVRRKVGANMEGIKRIAA